MPFKEKRNLQLKKIVGVSTYTPTIFSVYKKVERIFYGDNHLSLQFTVALLLRPVSAPNAVHFPPAVFEELPLVGRQALHYRQQWLPPVLRGVPVLCGLARGGSGGMSLLCSPV